MQNRNSLAAHVAKRILQGAIPSSKIGQMRIFESMADQFVDCSELVLLYKFYTFKRRLCEGNLRQAIQLLHELFIDNSSPIEFHVTLAEETARLLNAFQQELLSTEPFDPATVREFFFRKIGTWEFIVIVLIVFLSLIYRGNLLSNRI